MKVVTCGMEVMVHRESMGWEYSFIVGGPSELEVGPQFLLAWALLKSILAKRWFHLLWSTCLITDVPIYSEYDVEAVYSQLTGITVEAKKHRKLCIAGGNFNAEVASSGDTDNSTVSNWPNKVGNIVMD